MVGLLGVCVLERLFFLAYPPVSYSDTSSYRRLSETVLNGWVNYDGTRTPGYPVFLAIVGSDQSVIAAQMVMGILITLILFYIGYQISHQPLFAGVGALAHTLNLNQLFFETNLITETVATFWVMLALLGAAYWIFQADKRSIWLGLATGLFASLAALTRPLFIFLPFWLAIFMALTDIFVFTATGFENGKVIGRLNATGLRPKFMDKIETSGIHLPASIFGIGQRRY